MTVLYESSRSGGVTIFERGEGGDHQKVYVVLGTTSEATASSLVRAAAPLAVIAGDETLVRQRAQTKPLAPDAWEVELFYGPESDQKSQQRPQPGTWKFAFDTTGARHTLTVAKMISRHWGSSFSEAPDLKGALNWDGERVKGVEVPVPNGKFQITAYYEPSVVTTEFMRNLMRATPRKNSDTWLGFEPGEVMYLGTQGQGDIPTVAGQRVAPIPLVHHFDASENRTNIEIDGIIEGKLADGTTHNSIDARGWDYLWVRFQKREDEDLGQVVPRPAHVYVHELVADMAFGEFFGFPQEAE